MNELNPYGKWKPIEFHDPKTNKSLLHYSWHQEQILFTFATVFYALLGRYGTLTHEYAWGFNPQTSGLSTHSIPIRNPFK